MAESNGHHPTAGLPLQTLEALASRASLAQRLGYMFDGTRKIHEILGYKPTLLYRDFKARYIRQDLAHRIVKAYPEATWSQPPGVAEDDQEDQETPFEAAWQALVQRLNLFSTLERTDVLANLGQYAVLLIGLRGQSDLQNPARPVRSPEDILYLTPYSEEWASIERFEGNPGVATFGHPLLYRINFGRNTERGKQPLPVGQGMVHASRVLHVAEDVLDDEVYGIPRLEVIYDKLDDLLKVVGGSAEMYYRDAKRRIALELRDDYQLRPEDEAALTEEIEEYVHDLKDFIRVAGVDVKNLSGTVASPRDHFDVIMDVMSAATAIPKRILLGSERGELASSQDSEAWLQRITRRQKQFAEQRILRPLIDRFLMLQALPAPEQDYQITWDNLLSLSEPQQAIVAKDVATALNQFAAADASGFNPLAREVFITEYLGLSLDAMAEVLDLEPDAEDDMAEEVSERNDPSPSAPDETAEDEES